MTKTKKIIIISSVLLIIAIIAIVVTLVRLSGSFVVTYDLAGGTMEETETRVRLDSEYVLPIPSKRGYAFAGWYDGEKLISTNGIWKLERDVMLTAAWEIRDVNGVVFSPVKDGYIVIGYNGDINKTIMIPTVHNDIKVVGIQEGAFTKLDAQVENANNKYIKIYIPSTIISKEESQGLAKNLMISRYSHIDNDDIMYLEENGVFSVVGYKGDYKQAIHIPEIYEGKPVTSIGDYAFYGSTYAIPLQKNDFYRIRIPLSITNVGKSAFGKCDGAKALLYTLKGDSIREIIDKSQQYDWYKNVTIADGNNELLKVISQIQPAFGWREYTDANYYVRLNAMGGTITKLVEVKNEDGKIVTIPVNVKDATYRKGKAYDLPVPVREGYTFDGWYYNDKLVSIHGDSWNYDTHIEFVAKWTEIQKEG